VTPEESADVDGVDDLYALDPGQFVAARDQLAKRLRAEGERDASAAVKKLRRPTVVAWALNQVARAHPDEVAELVEAGAAVRRAQAAALGAGDGDGDAEDLRDAGRQRQRMVTTLARATLDLAGATHYDEAVATLNAASLDPHAGSLLRRGRLTKELTPASGFEAAGVPQPLATAAPPTARPQELERLRDDVARAERRVGAARVEMEHAEARLASARASADAAQEALDAVVGERDRARAALAEAEGE
jgi:hypothetical protein